MSHSMRFVVTPLPVSDDTLFDCIKDAASRPARSINTPQATNNTTSVTATASATPLSLTTNTLANNPTTASAAHQASSATTAGVVLDLNQASSSGSQQISQISSAVFSASQQHLNAIRSVPVSQLVVGPRHVGVLLEDGRVYRAPYQVHADRLEFPNNTADSTSAQISSLTSSGLNVAGSSGNISSSHAPQAQHTHGAQSASAVLPPGPPINSISKPPLSGSASGSSAGIAGVISQPSNMTGGLDARGSVSNPGSSGPSGSSNVQPFSNTRVNISPQVGSLTSVQHRQVARRGRMFRHTATRGRGPSVIMSGGRSVIPASYVPEDLINQAQVVLQGKPRSAIVRELQRTNLDVNSAVNNLLSSDNEDAEDMDESQDYLPNEDLMSLLDSSVSLPSGPASVLIDAETVFPEDVFNHYPGNRMSRSNFRHSVGSGRSNSDRESSLASELEVRRMGSRDPSQSRRWLEHALRDPQNSDSTGGNKMGSATPTDFTLHQKSDSNSSMGNSKKNISTPEINPIHISDSIELWPNSGDKRFVQIACMHSELIAISTTGQIHQWKWSESSPFEGIRYGDIINYHPKVAHLNLTNEKIQMISASCIRATVITESLKIATWIDDSISSIASKLEHSAQNFPEFQRGDKIAQMHSCSLYTCVRLESGSMYWWGVAPFSQRKKNWKKIQSKSTKHASANSGGNEIGVGSIVCLKNGPSFGDGAIGFTTKDGVPRVGRLTMSAWNITDTCNFKIIQSAEKKSQTQSSQGDTKSSSQRMKKLLCNQPIDFTGTSSDPEQQAPSSPGISKTASTTTSSSSSSERLEMPPPPSPASSTCSEPGCSPSHKRKHKHLLSFKDDDRYRDEEPWNLRDVIFLEEVKKPPAAKVIKLDGNTALVRFNQPDPFDNQSNSNVNAYLEGCRMIRKEELQLAKETTSSSRIIDCQRSPKKINIPDSRHFLTFAVSNSGIHALVKNGPKLEYKMYQLASGKVSKSLYFPTDTTAFLGRDPSLISLYACGESDVAVTLRDGNGSLYPLARDFLDSLREPQPLDMAPIQAMGMTVHPARDPNNSTKINPTLVMAVALENQILMPAVLRSDPEFVRLTLASLEQQPVSQQIVASEKIDLNRNILHAAVYSCAPSPIKNSTDKGSFRLNDDSFDPAMSRLSSVITETLRRTRVKRESSSLNQQNSTLDLSSSDHRQNRQDQEQQPQQQPPEPTVKIDPMSAIDWSNTILNKIEIDPSEQKQSAHMVLFILVECPFLRPYLKNLMVQKDAHGMTPFMSAVSARAYSAALILLDLAHWITKQEAKHNQEQCQRLFYSMIFPTGTNLDNNPLYMLCANDTCSFTWTGAQHINQDIFECKTCGLTKTLCCCTECARTCHKGHDCRLKKTSPTAYCDCWEKCKCKSLVPGSNITRFKLLEKLLVDTDLVTYPDSKGESILLFLVQTVGRQIIEQRQYAPDRQSSRQSKRDEPSDMPDHDLSPPRFARKALNRLLGEWPALKTVIMSGTSSIHNLANAARQNSLLNAEDQMFLSNQQGTALLDRFTHSLLIKIGPEMLDVLLSAIIRESSSNLASRVYEARIVAKRFVRSVARNGVVLSVELSPVNYSQPMSISDLSSSSNFNPQASPYNAGGASNQLSANLGWKSSQQPASILQKCRKVFQALLPIAAEELAEIADALISPVRLGVPRPTAPFSLVNSMAEATQGSEEIFVVDPVVLPTNPSVDNLLSSASQQALRSGSVSLPSGGSQPSAASIIPQVFAPNSGAERMREVLHDNEMVMEAIDSEDADASNNTFRRSNNGDSDSDSDSNMDDASLQSNIEPNGARSTTTGATAGSEVGASTLADDSSDSEIENSSNADEDEESEANDTEQDNEDLSFAHEDNFSVSRRSAISNAPTGSLEASSALSQPQSIRSANLGQQLHWALRHRDHAFYQHQSSSFIPTTAARLASIGLVNAYGSYLDGAPNRRSAMATSNTTGNLTGTTSELSMSTTSVGLARAFSIIIRSISDLIPILKESERCSIPSSLAAQANQLSVSPAEAAIIICNLEKKLNPIWEWLFQVMDSTEGQLRFGCALTNGIQAVASQTVGGYHTSNVQRGLSHAQQGQVALNPSIINSVIAQQQSGPYTLPVTPAMLARINSTFSAQNLNRRVVPNLFDEARAQSSSGAGLGSANPGDPPGVRIHNSIGQSSSANRPQSLTTRSNLDPPTYVRVPITTGSPSSSDNTVDGAAARRDFLNYMISLIRGHGNEHHDSLPILDVSSLRHIAYVFDAYVYYLRALNHQKIAKPSDDSNFDDEDLSTSLIASQTLGSRHHFFRRSESTLFLDGVAPDPFSQPLSEALPLAEQPHLLQPNSRREDLFGIAKMNQANAAADSLPLSLSSTSSYSCNNCIAQQQRILTQNILDSSSFNPSGKLQLDQNSMQCPLHKRASTDQSLKPVNEFQHTALLGRWRLTVELFGREFLDDVGAEPGSILTDLVGFPLKEVRFRREMERLRGESAPREISLTNIDRDKNTLIRQTIKELNNTFHMAERNQSRRNVDLPLLACSKVKVSFKDEKGEGNGVARSFYTAFCEAVLSSEKLANLDMPLFYQPGLRNFYSPRQGDPTPERLNVFRNIGRVIGICLSQSEICPIQLNRHVIKYILRRPISWHDLAFFDPILYESLRQLVLDTETHGPDSASSALQALDLRFCVDLGLDEGAMQQVELAPGGKEIEVTTENIYEYVRRYALKRMLKTQERALQSMRQGVMDVLPPTALDNLTAEDFRLLLNGVGEINVQTLISYTTFIDDRGTSASKRPSMHIDEQFGCFKKWFWSIVEKMTTKERQDLVYFWTGSPSLPASEEGFQPMPTVSIRPAEDLHLPTSNVCIFRLYIPLYSSKAILRSKLLIAIKEKNFGFV